MQEDLERILGLPISYLNDCDALTLSEAVFGAGANHRRVAAVILGTGVGGGLVQDGRVLPGAVGLGGEFGHTGAAAAPLAAFDLPVFDCGCGRRGCVETYLSGPGVQRLARHMTGADLSPEQIVLRRHGDMAQVWAAWCAIAGEFFHALTLIAAPDIIVLGGGLSQISGIVQDITQAAKAAQLTGFDEVPLVLAQGGETSGAKGAAFAALQAAQAADEGRAKGQDDDGR